MDLAENLLIQVSSTIAFYDKLSDDMSKAFHALRNFVSNIDEADRFDEEHLLPLATDPYQILIRSEQSEALFSAFYSLTYREQEVIRSHLGFCPNCHSTKSPKFRPQTFQEIAIQNELTSAQAAENIYHKAIAKIRKKLKHERIVYPQLKKSLCSAQKDVHLQVIEKD